MIKRTTSFKEPKVDKGGFTVKDQGRVKYASIESVEASASPKPVWAKVSLEAVARHNEVRTSKAYSNERMEYAT